MKSLPTVPTRLDEAISRAIDVKTKPLGSLGRMEELARIVCRVQQTLRPRMQRCRLLIFAADHGVVEDGVSAYPQEVTGQMVHNFLAGGAAANVFAVTNGVDLAIVDAGIAGDPIVDSRLISRRIGAGTRNFVHKPAMTGAEVETAVKAGDDLGRGGNFDAIACGDMGIGNTSSATMLAHKLLQEPIARLAGRGTGLDDGGLAHKVQLLERASARTAEKLDARTALEEYGGFEIAMMAGAMLGAADAGRIVLVDGFIGTAAALCAVRLNPALRDYLVFAHRSAEKGHAIMLEALEADPLLDLSMRLGEGTGALLAWPLLRIAAAMMSDMASFETAGVSGPS